MRPPLEDGVLVAVGGVHAACDWAGRHRFQYSASSELTLQQFSAAVPENVTAACITFASPPVECLPVFAPSPCPCHALGFRFAYTFRLALRRLSPCLLGF